MDDAAAPSAAARLRRVVAAVGPYLLILVVFVGFALAVRGIEMRAWVWLNPDEAELMAQARAALASPVPYTTWTLGTTGPTWPLTLALLGALGFPLTIAAAHFLSALITGLIGAGGFLLARRALGTGWGLVVTVVWWVPLALVFPLGGPDNFGALNTEYLPGVLIVLIALIGFRPEGGRPVWLVLAGVLAVIALGAKFQIAPLAAIILLLIVLRTRQGLASWARGVGWVSLGVLGPVVILVGVVLLAPAASDVLIAQQFDFLGSYADETDLASRVTNSWVLFKSARWFLIAATALVVLLCIRSDLRTALARIAIVAAGVVAVIAGGRGFAHYLIILVVAFGIAVSLPVRDRVSPIPGKWALPVAATLALVGVVGLTSFGVVRGHIEITRPAALAASLSPDSVLRNAALADACPPGSRVVVWGWAAELYVDQGWSNAIPYFNILPLEAPGDYRSTAEPVVLDGIESADCIVEALGPPFFRFGAEWTVDAIYPSAQRTIDRDFRLREDVIDGCDGCNVYVRR